MQHLLRALETLFVACSFALGTFTSWSHETDNFNLPLDIELADIGDFLEMAHTMALEETVAEINARIEKELSRKSGTAGTDRLKELHDPLTLVKAFMKRFGHPMFEDTRAESTLSGDWARKMYPGQKPSYQDIGMNFSAHSWLDPRWCMVPTQSRTVKAYGVYFGTDKLVHFHHLGADYYERYRMLVSGGMTKEDACRNLTRHFAERAVFSERTFFGTITTGVFSNADLAANHLGFKFFLNFAETVTLKGKEQRPLLVRAGVFWRVNLHVRARSGWLAPFFSDHWNEALNPNRYDSWLAPGIRRGLETRARSIVAFYTQKDGRPNSAEYFDRLARELSTYYGESYGHCGEVDKLMTIGNTCFPALK